MEKWSAGNSKAVLPHMLGLRHHRQVAWVIVELVAVNVMNNLTGQEGAANLLFGYDSMLMTTEIFAIRSPFAATALRCAVLLSVFLSDAPVELRTLRSLPDARLGTIHSLATLAGRLEYLATALTGPRIVARFCAECIGLAFNRAEFGRCSSAGLDLDGQGAV
jgi:hypothetical protein